MKMVVFTLLGILLVSVLTASVSATGATTGASATGAATAATAATVAEGVAEKKETRVKRSDDTSLASLNAVVQEQAARLQSLQARLTALENKQPASFQPVAFTARFSQDYTPAQHGVALGPHGTLQFDTVVTNAGNAYSPQTGIFTAPVSGLYVFLLSAMGSDVHGYVQVVIVRGGHTVLAKLYAEGASDNNDQGSTQVSVHLSSGEQVWVRQEAGDLIRGGFWTTFTGYLLQAE